MHAGTRKLSKRSRQQRLDALAAAEAERKAKTNAFRLRLIDKVVKRILAKKKSCNSCES